MRMCNEEEKGWGYLFTDSQKKDFAWIGCELAKMNTCQHWIYQQSQAIDLFSDVIEYWRLSEGKIAVRSKIFS